MEDSALIDDPLNQDIVALLLLTKFTDSQKRFWLAALEYMTVEEKEQLRARLNKELDYELGNEERAVKQFAEAFKNAPPDNGTPDSASS